MLKALIPITFLLISCCCHLLEGIASDYPRFCSQALQDPALFENFRSHVCHQEIYDTSPSLGQEYLNFISIHYPHLISHFDACRKNDTFGNPPLSDYGHYGEFCPQTLKEIKLIGDLKSYFGDLSHLKIVEIGNGYGGVCHLLHKLGGYASYTIIGQKECNELAKKYLELQGVRNVDFIDIHEFNDPHPCDLVICNDTFSQMNNYDQVKCFNNLLKYASKGYLTLNLSSSDEIISLSVNSFISFLYSIGKKGKVEAEMPSILNRMIIQWQSAWPNEGQKSMTSSPNLSHRQKNNAITYTLSGGRLGDNLRSYLTAKWVSEKYSIPLIFVPFQYSECFRCHYSDLKLEQLNFAFSEKRDVHSLQELEEMSHYSSTLFCIPYYGKNYRYESSMPWNAYPFIDLENSNLKNKLKRSLEIVVPHQTFALPKDKVSVAVHVRRVDHPASFTYFALKFPHDSYYIQQIQSIYEILNTPLYVYIFTDDLNPQSLVSHYQEVFKQSAIEFACRTSDNSPHNTLLDDFYMLTQFDCIIRPDSNFSLVAARLGDYKIEIAPRRCKWMGDQLIVDQVDILFNPSPKELLNRINNF